MLEALTRQKHVQMYEAASSLARRLEGGEENE